MTNTMEQKKNTRNTGGRKPKLDPVKHRYMVNFNDDENTLFRQKFEDSGLDCYSKFIKAVLFKREIKVVKVDKTTLDYYVRLTQFYRQQLQPDRADVEDELRREACLADALPIGTMHHRTRRAEQIYYCPDKGIRS